MNPIAFLLHDYITQVIKTNYSTTDSSYDQRQKNKLFNSIWFGKGECSTWNIPKSIKTSILRNIFLSTHLPYFSLRQHPFYSCL